MDATQMKQVIKKHYGLSRPVTDAEVRAEVESLRHKDARSGLDDFSEKLYVRLRLDSE